MTSPDWFIIISDLIRHQVPMAKVRHHCDLKMGKALLVAYRAGTQPSYPRGEALVNLWLKVTGKSVDDLPRKQWTPPFQVRSIRQGVSIRKQKR